MSDWISKKIKIILSFNFSLINFNLKILLLFLKYKPPYYFFLKPNLYIY